MENRPHRARTRHRSVGRGLPAQQSPTSQTRTAVLCPSSARRSFSERFAYLRLHRGPKGEPRRDKSLSRSFVIGFVRWRKACWRGPDVAYQVGRTFGKGGGPGSCDKGTTRGSGLRGTAQDQRFAQGCCAATQALLPDRQQPNFFELRRATTTSPLSGATVLRAHPLHRRWPQLQNPQKS